MTRTKQCTGKLYSQLVQPPLLSDLHSDPRTEEKHCQLLFEAPRFEAPRRQCSCSVGGESGKTGFEFMEFMHLDTGAPVSLDE